MITTELKELVIDEAVQLSLYAAHEEKEKLNLENLTPNNTTLCIYGQMTGDCFSDRAGFLLNKCAVPYSDALACYVETTQTFFMYSTDRPFSPIEVYITQAEAQNGILVDFIKGKIDTLTIEML